MIFLKNWQIVKILKLKIDNSYELAKSINIALSEYNFYEIDRSEIWDWIAMILFDQIFVPGKIRGAFHIDML